MTLLLALDTSTTTASVALFDGERVLSETTWLAGREHSTRVLVEVEIALGRAGRTQDSLTGLAVARGPGSYTGVRVALSVAKGIAAALRVPVWGISSLDALAFATPSDLPVRAVLEAGRGRYATALYEHAAPIESARLMTLDQLHRAIDRDTLIVGELRDEGRAALGQNPRAHLAPRAAAARRAGYVAELGWQCAQRGDPGDPTTLDAVYLG